MLASSVVDSGRPVAGCCIAVVDRRVGTTAGMETAIGWVAGALCVSWGVMEGVGSEGPTEPAGWACRGGGRRDQEERSEAMHSPLPPLLTSALSWPPLLWRRALSSGMLRGRSSSGRLCRNSCSCFSRRLYSEVAAAFSALAGPEEGRAGGRERGHWQLYLIPRPIRGEQKGPGYEAAPAHACRQQLVSHT